MGILAWVTGGSDRRARRFLLAGSRLRAGAVLAGLVLLGASVPASAQTLTWSVVPSPSLAGHYNNLHGVSCASAAACTAVGDSYTTSNGAYATLVESWNGTSWSVVPSPSRGSGGNFLDGVSCASAAACTAVGYYGAGRTLVESWNGTSWSVVPSPNYGSGGNFLHGVSCVSAAACTAVGYYATSSGSTSRTLVESWNGTSWSVVPSPNPAGHYNDLYGVSCVSAAACTAVGLADRAGLVESWNGTSWSVVPSPDPGSVSSLYGVSCVSAAACIAVGDHGAGRTLVESWNGTSWSVVPSPNYGSGGNFLHGVSLSCVSAAACIAVGDHGAGRTLVESWNGTSWSVVPSPSRGSGGSFLYGVSCASAACTAAGYYATSSGDRTLIESGTAASR
jgi:hypothetical protein